MVHVQDNNLLRMVLNKLRHTLQLYQQFPCLKPVYQVLGVGVPVQEHSQVYVPYT